MLENNSIKATHYVTFPFQKPLPFVSLTSNILKQNNHPLILVPRRLASCRIKESIKLGNKWLMRDRNLG